MDVFITDYISAFTAETGRQPTYEEYAQIMTGYSPEQVPVISTIARGFATFDHWHCEVPSQTFTNRSFYHAASSSGFVVNAPYENFPLHNDAETIFERLEAAGLSWRVYVDPGMRMSITGMIHAPRLSRYFASNFSTLADFFDDAERGRLPAYSFIEPCLIHAHNDYHPAINALLPGVSADSPSSILGGEELLSRIYTAVRASSTAGGSNFANTLLLVAFDEHGGNFDHVPPPRVDPPDPHAEPELHGRPGRGMEDGCARAERSSTRLRWATSSGPGHRARALRGRVPGQVAADCLGRTRTAGSRGTRATRCRRRRSPCSAALMRRARVMRSWRADPRTRLGRGAQATF